MSKDNTFRPELIEQYLKSRLSEEDFLATLTPNDREAYRQAKILVRRAVTAELTSQISTKPTKAGKGQGRMSRVGLTRSSSHLD